MKSENTHMRPVAQKLCISFGHMQLKHCPKKSAKLKTFFPCIY
jgi:hypothetical protein